jgi:hypothetical protein
VVSAREERIMQRNRVGIVSVAALVGLAGTAWGQVIGETHSGQRSVRHVIDRGEQIATLPDGQLVAMPTQEVWKPICWNKAAMTEADLATMSVTHEADFADPTRVIIVDDPFSGRAGLDVVFVLGASVPAAAIPAFAAAEAYLQSQFTGDTMTVTIPVSFAALSPGVIGGTGSSYGSLTWASTRSTLVGGMDGTDTIQSSLPTASLPVRYSTSSTTNENQCFWTFANFKANGGSVAGNDGSMQYSTAFPFDYDPSNGVSANTISLQDVIIHETGHALGCVSGVDFRTRDIEVLDIFRFRRTDGTSDFNPDTAAEFTARPRWAVFNNPNDDVNLDVISAEYRLSDGSPWQASHFREQVPAIGIMDPAFSYGETFYPSFLRTSDITLFDAIGYDR